MTTKPILNIDEIAQADYMDVSHGDSFAVRARRVDGDWWEVQSDPL